MLQTYKVCRAFGNHGLKELEGMSEKNKSMSSDHELLIRIDERTKRFDGSIDAIKASMVTQKEFEVFVVDIRGDMKKMVTHEEFKPFKEAVAKLDQIFVTKVEHKPIRTIAYGFLTLLCSGVFLILIAALIAAATK